MLFSGGCFHAGAQRCERQTRNPGYECASAPAVTIRFLCFLILSAQTPHYRCTSSNIVLLLVRFLQSVLSSESCSTLIRWPLEAQMGAVIMIVLRFLIVGHLFEPRRGCGSNFTPQ